MKIFEDLSQIKKDKNTVLTLGTFDGVHLGHQQIIKEVVKKARLSGSRSFLITFHPHPVKVISGKHDIRLLSTVKEKTSAIESLGIENLFIINFTEKFSQLSAEDFVKNYILDSIGLREIIIGYNHHFGKGRSGNIETLRELGKEFNFKVDSVSEFKINSETVSSSKIRKAVEEGRIDSANAFLGRCYSFSGKVIEGDRRGRQLGFPTANIILDDEEKLLPAIGIYVVEFFVNNEKFYGLLSIGKRPTFYNEGKLVPEVYIYDFDSDIYGKSVSVNVIRRLRGEEKFNSAGELIVQMNKDKIEGLKILNNIRESEEKEV